MSCQFKLTYSIRKAKTVEKKFLSMSLRNDFKFGTKKTNLHLIKVLLKLSFVKN